MKKILTILLLTALAITSYAQDSLFTYNDQAIMYNDSLIANVTASDGESTGHDTITCTDAGIIYTASSVYEGYWEWDFYSITAGLKYLTVSFYDNNYTSVGDVGGVRWFTGYVENADAANSGAASMWTTGSSYFTAGNWYRIRIERNSFTDEFFTGDAGDLRGLIKGTGFGDGDTFVQIDESGGTGSNPYTGTLPNASSYFVIETVYGSTSDSDFRIANININGTTKTYEDFTVSSGTWSGE